MRAPHDRLDVLDLTRLEQHVLHRDEQRPLVDLAEHVVRRRDLEPAPRLEHVANRREVLALVDDSAPLAGLLEAREDDRLGNGHVLVHAHRPRRRADDAADLVTDRERCRPPPLAPRADPALGPRARVLAHPLLDRSGHRSERVVDQVRRVLEDRKAIAVIEQVAHRNTNSRMTAIAFSGWSRKTP
jgi:hypothetical protein